MCLSRAQADKIEVSEDCTGDENSYAQSENDWNSTDDSDYEDSYSEVSQATRRVTRSMTRLAR